MGSSGIVKIHQVVRYGFEPTNRGVSQVQAALTAARLTEECLELSRSSGGMSVLRVKCMTLGYQVQLCHVLSTEV